MPSSWFDGGFCSHTRPEDRYLRWSPSHHLQKRNEQDIIHQALLRHRKNPSSKHIIKRRLPKSLEKPSKLDNYDGSWIQMSTRSLQKLLLNNTTPWMSWNKYFVLTLKENMSWCGSVSWRTVPSIPKESCMMNLQCISDNQNNSL